MKFPIIKYFLSLPLYTQKLLRVITFGKKYRQLICNLNFINRNIAHILYIASEKNHHILSTKEYLNLFELLK